MITRPGGYKTTNIILKKTFLFLPSLYTYIYFQSFTSCISGAGVRIGQAHGWRDEFGSSVLVDASSMATNGDDKDNTHSCKCHFNVHDYLFKLVGVVVGWGLDGGECY